VSKGEGVKLSPRCISSSVVPRKKIPMAIPMFSRFSVSTVLTVISPDVDIIPEIDMAAAKQEIIISRATRQLGK